MVFSSIIFLFYFLPVVLILYFLTPKKHRNLVLFVSSLFFYAWGEPIYVLMMIFSVVFNFTCGKYIGKTTKKSLKKNCLKLSVAVNLGFLIVFKYTDFFISAINTVLPWKIPTLNLTLPIGISFYTFQTMSYVIDVYRGKIPAQKNLVKFGTYVALFPQLIAGPIVRYTTIAKELEQRNETIEGFAKGTMRFVVGLGKKVLLANNIGQLWTALYDPANFSVASAWLGIVAFALQIYFDFSGYSDMAIGLGKMFGFTFDENFRYPYISDSVTDFWRRWHISLSTWFKEYVYIPLGGNRKGEKRTRLNLLIVWMLTGFWHGANFTFLAWGLYYGVLLIFEKQVFGKILKKMPYCIRLLYTVVCVLIGWALFASDSIGDAVRYVGVMFGFMHRSLTDSAFWYHLAEYKIWLPICIIGCAPPIGKMMKKISNRAPAFCIVPVALLLILCTAYLVDSTYNPFLYFRF